MKRVLIVYHYFALYRLPVLRELAGASDDCEFVLISASESRGGIRTIPPDSLKEEGLQWQPVDNYWVGGKRSPFLWQKGLLDYLRNDDYDAVIFLGAIYYLTTWLGIRVAKKRNKRVILWTHGLLGKDLPILAAVRHRLYRSADACLLYGNHARDLMTQAGGYDSAQLYVIYNSLDHRMHSRLREFSLPEQKACEKQRLFGESESAVIGYIGRLTEGKSLDLLIRSAVRSKQLGYAFKLLFIGDGPAKVELESLARDSGLAEDVLFYGYCDGKEACRVLSAADICVVPGSVGLTAIHAMALGVPVLSHSDVDTQKPEYEAIVEGRTGGSFQKGDVEDLALKMCELYDLNTKEPMRDNCLKMVDSLYNPSYQTERILDAVDGKPFSGELHPGNLFS